MVVHACKSCQLGEAQASYLDERKGLLRFDDGYEIALGSRELGLDLNVVLALHGAERTGSSTVVDGGPMERDITSLRDRVLAQPNLPSRMYDHFRPNGKARSLEQAKKAPWAPANHGLTLSVTSVPGADWTSARYAAWDKFLTGLWLERWTASLIESCAGPSVPVAVGVKCKRKLPVATEFEIDIALMRGPRLYVVSCTTDSTKKLCKSKLFEVAMRARQMGGDLARSAVVCLLDGGDDKSSYIDQLRGDIAALWAATNIPKVFGLADLREWAETSGMPNLDTLKEWLDS
jgi:hypothetical protein